jgi:hypothetical protein
MFVQKALNWNVAGKNKIHQTKNGVFTTFNAVKATNPNLPYTHSADRPTEFNVNLFNRCGDET